MTIGSLFAGIGGFELAATWAGITPIWSNEIDSFPCKVLRKNFTHQVIEADIRTIGKNKEHELKPVDIICGGFPCQPFSTAGKRKGKADDRYLWPEMLRVIREVRPTWIVGENVAGLLSMDGGGVFDEICTSLENEGYQVEAFVIPACATGAPHRRDRLWIVANDFSKRRRSEETGRLDLDGGILENTGRKKNTVGCPAYCGEFERHTSNTQVKNDGRHTREPERRQEQEFRECSFHGITPHSEHIQRDRGMDGKPRGAQPSDENTNIEHAKSFGWHERKGWPEWLHKDAREGYRGQWGTHWHKVATRLCRMDDGVPAWVDAHRTRRLKALGNAIVPQVAYEIFRAILKS